MCDTENQIHQISLFYLSGFLVFLADPDVDSCCELPGGISKGSLENVFEQKLHVGFVWSQSIFSCDTIQTPNQLCPHSDRPETPLTQQTAYIPSV